MNRHTSIQEHKSLRQSFANAFKRKPIVILFSIFAPPSIGLASGYALGWLRLDWSLAGVLYVLGAYFGWIFVLAALAEIFGFLRGQEQPSPDLLNKGEEKPEIQLRLAPGEPTTPQITKGEILLNCQGTLGKKQELVI